MEGIEFTDEELAKARYAMLFRFVSRSDVSAVDEQDFNARWRVSRGISRLIVFSAADIQT